MWQHGWEGSLGDNGYLYMYGGVTLLCTRNYHNIVNRPHCNINNLLKDQKEKKVQNAPVSNVFPSSQAFIYVNILVGFLEKYLLAFRLCK